MQTFKKQMIAETVAVVLQQDVYALEDSLYIDDIYYQAKHCIKKFFKDKKFWAGGTINITSLLTDANIKTVTSTKLCDALDVAYRSLEAISPENWDVSKASWDCKLVFSILQSLAKNDIPKSSAGGLLLIYLEQCHGVETLRRLEKFNSYRKLLLDSLKIQINN